MVLILLVYESHYSLSVCVCACECTEGLLACVTHVFVWRPGTFLALLYWLLFCCCNRTQWKSLFELRSQRTRVYTSREETASRCEGWSRKLRGHILNHRHKAGKQTRNNVTLLTQSSPPVPSDTLPPTRPHSLHLPEQHPKWGPVLKYICLWGTCSLKPPQPSALAGCFCFYCC